MDLNSLAYLAPVRVGTKAMLDELSPFHDSRKNFRQKA